MKNQEKRHKEMSGMEEKRDRKKIQAMEIISMLRALVTPSPVKTRWPGYRSLSIFHLRTGKSRGKSPTA